MTEQEKAIKSIKDDLEWHKKELKPKYREYLNMAIKALEEHDRHRWIPVSERLPDNEVEVMICARSKIRGEYKYTITSGIYEDGTKHTGDSDCIWHDCDFDYCEETDDYIIEEGWWEYRHYNPDYVSNNLIDDEVVAWKPMPTYKEEE